MLLTLLSVPQPSALVVQPPKFSVIDGLFIADQLLLWRCICRRTKGPNSFFSGRGRCFGCEDANIASFRKQRRGTAQTFSGHRFEPS